MSDKIEKEKTIKHPMEEVFDIEEGTTIVPYTEVSTEMVKAEEYDEKDSEIETQFQDVYDAAMTAFENQEDELDVIDPKYRARTAEVAVQFLNTALNAAKEKANIKQHKDKLGVTKQQKGSDVVNNNLIVDRNELLKMMAEQEPQKPPIDVTPESSTDASEEESSD